MQNTDNEPIMDNDDAHNFEHKMLRSRIFAEVKPLLTNAAQITNRFLTPEVIAQVFEELGISAAERGEPIHHCPFPSGSAATEFGLLCRHDWLKGWRTAMRGMKRQRKAAR